MGQSPSQSTGGGDFQTNKDGTLKGENEIKLKNIGIYEPEKGARENVFDPDSCVTTVFKWTGGGHDVKLKGTFNGGKRTIPMQRSGHDFTCIIDLPRGKHAYKFVVDSDMRHDPDVDKAVDESGDIYNVLDLTGFKCHDNLEQERKQKIKRTGTMFEGKYGFNTPDLVDYSSEPPQLPPHLRHIILNHQDNVNGGEHDFMALPKPQHVTLDHLYCTAVKHGLMVLGTTSRYKKKFVTSVFYSKARIRKKVKARTNIQHNFELFKQIKFSAHVKPLATSTSEGSYTRRRFEEQHNYDKDMASKSSPAGRKAMTSTEMDISTAVDAQLSRNLASRDKAITPADTYSAPTELRNRGVDMQRALNAAMYGTSRTINRGKMVDHKYAEQKLEEINAERARVIAHLRKTLLDYTDKEARLVQEVSRLQTEEGVMKERLKVEQKERAGDRKSLREAENDLKDMHQKVSDRSRNLESGKKAICLLEMKIRDLNAQMTDTNQAEHRTSGNFLESNRNVRELERELFDLSINNEKVQDGIETLVEKKQRLFQETERVKDETLRDSQRANVQRIALEHNLKSLLIEKEPLDSKHSDILTEYRDCQSEMETQQELHENTKLELEKRLADEEAANNELVKEIAAKAAVESGFAADLAEETAAKDVLARQIADKDGLCLEMGKRLHKLESLFVALSRELKEKDAETERLVNDKESALSSVKILNANLEAEQESTRKLTAWSQTERIAAEELDTKLTLLKNNETTHAIAVKEQEAMEHRMKTKMVAVENTIRKVKADLHDSLATLDFRKEKLEEIEDDLNHFNDKFSKEALVVEKLQRQLNDRVRVFEKKHKQFTLAKNDFEGKIGEKDDEIGRLDAKMKKSDGQVENMQQMLEEAAEKAEHERHLFAEKINELDDLNQQLNTELHQQISRNARMEEDLRTSGERIRIAGVRMSENENKAAELAKLNEEELMELQMRLKSESDKAHTAKAVLDKDKHQLKLLKGEFDAADHEKRRAQMGVRQEKHDHDDISRKLEDDKEMELERLKRVEDLEGERDRLQSHIDEKEDRAQNLKSALGKNRDQADIMKKELHDAEVREANYYSQQAIDRSKVETLESELKIQEEQHVQDANAVKLKITQLQDALHEKIHTVQKLEKAVAAMRQHAASLQMRLEQTEAESAHCMSSFERMLDSEQNDVAKLRNASETLTRKLMHLRQADLKEDESVFDLNTKIGEKKTENDSLLSETYRKDRQAHNDELDSNRLSIRERDQIMALDDLAETASELRLKERESSHNEQDLHRMLVE
eukprot:g3298.t1